MPPLNEDLDTPSALLMALLHKLSDLGVDAAASPSGASRATDELDELIKNVPENAAKPGARLYSAAIPKDYDDKGLSMYAFDSKRTDHASDMLLITAIPPRPNTIIPSADDPDGHSEWIVHGPTKAKIVNGPGYLKPVPKPPLPRPSYVVKSSPGKGVGVFATRDIKAGELVLSERPLLVTPKSTMGLAMQLNDVMNEQNYDLETRKAILAMEWEKYLTVAVDRMLPEDKEEFMKLANCHQHDDDGPISGIVRTNSFMLDGLYDGREEREDGLNTYGGVTKIGSRFNHSCIPNIEQRFLMPSFSFQFTAKVDIKAGEELFCTYCDTYAPVAERRAQLAPYGFTCHCRACEEDDALHREYKERTKEYMLTLNWAGKGNPDESIIRPVWKLSEDLEREKMTNTREFKSTVLMLWKFYEGTGKVERAKQLKDFYKQLK